MKDKFKFLKKRIKNFLLIILSYIPKWRSISLKFKNFKTKILL